MLKTQNKLIALFVSTFLIFSLFFINNKTYAASFSAGAGGSLTVGQTVSVTVSINRAAQYNTVTLNASLNNLIYVSSTVQGGWTPVIGPSFSGNTVTFTGFTASAKSGSTQVLRITFKAPNSPGNSSMSFSGVADGTGLGTGQESASGSISYSIKAAPTPTPTPKPAPNAVGISSTSHPDQNKWYKETSVSLTWDKPADVTDFSYVIDNIAATVPDDTSEGAGNTTTQTLAGEGNWYFHIKAKNDVGWGATSTYAINVDNTAPDPFTPTSVKNSDGSYNLYFSTLDKVSGVVTYNVTTDQKDFGPSSSGLQIPSDTKKITVTALDKAGNSKEASLNLETNSVTETPSTTPTPTETNTSSNNKNSTNIALVIALILVIIYALIITALYLLDKGYLRRVVKSLNGTKSFGKKEPVETSPFKEIKSEDKKP